jgi:superfamily II RNA helicase
VYVIALTFVRFLGFSDTQTLSVATADRVTFENFESKAPKLQNLPVSVIEDAQIRQLFPFETFNLIQSQLFFQTFHTDESILLCAPTAACKTVIAELAIARMLHTDDGYNAIYMVGLKSIVLERIADWRKKFGGLFVKLTSDFTPDSDSIARAGDYRNAWKGGRSVSRICCPQFCPECVRSRH